MRVLVTGAAGFIGRHLVNALNRREHTTVGLDKRWNVSTADLPDLGRFLAAAPPVDLIAHLGAQCSTARSLADPVGDHTDNAKGTVNVAEVARRGGMPVLYVSTVKVLPGHDGLIAPLGLSKRVGEDYLNLYRNLYGVPSVILRPSTVYGPGQRGTSESGWVTWFASAAVTHRRVEVAGDGTQSRDILYIADFVALLVDIIERFPAYATGDGPYEVGGGPDNEVTLLGLLSELGHTGITHVPRLPGDLQRVVSDNTRVTSVAGWQPATAWRDGLARTLTHLRGEYP